MDMRPTRRDRLIRLLPDRILLLLGSVTLLGAVMVAGGWAIQGAEYVPGLLLESGTAMMLLVPLALLGLVLEQRLRRAEQQIRATASLLDELNTATRERLADDRHRRQELFDLARQNPTQRTVRVLLREALDMGAVASDGIRVRVPGTPLRLRFQVVDPDAVQVRVEEADGARLHEFRWDADETGSQFALGLAEALRGRYPGDEHYDPAGVLRQLLAIVQIGVEGQTGEHPHDLGPIIEIPNDQWAVCSDGLFSMQRSYSINTTRIIHSREDWPRHMSSQAWVNIDAFNEAYELARALLR